MPNDTERSRTRRRALMAVLGVGVLMMALAAAWHWTPLKDVAEPRAVARWLDDSADSAWMPLLVAALHVSATMLMFPNTVMCLAIILALGPVAGTAYAFGGSLMASLAGYTTGRYGGKRVEKLRVRAVDKLTEQLRRGGFVQVLVLRVLPVAPFMATNIVCGAARVRLLPFLAATVIGISPYILAFAAFGRQARELVSDPSPTEIALTVAIVAASALALWRARTLAAARAK